MVHSSFHSTTRSDFKKPEKKTEQQKTFGSESNISSPDVHHLNRQDVEHGAEGGAGSSHLGGWANHHRDHLEAYPDWQGTHGARKNKIIIIIIIIIIIKKKTGRNPKNRRLTHVTSMLFLLNVDVLCNPKLVANNEFRRFLSNPDR